MEIKQDKKDKMCKINFKYLTKDVKLTPDGHYYPNNDPSNPNKYIKFDENGYIVEISKDENDKSNFTFQDYVNMFTDEGKKEYFKYFDYTEPNLLKRKLYLNDDKALAFKYDSRFETSFNNKQIFSFGGTTDFIGDILSKEGKEVYNKMMNLYTFNNNMSVDCIADYLEVDSILNLKLEISNDKVYVAGGGNNHCFTVENKDGEKIIIFALSQKADKDFNYRDLIDCFGKNIVQESLKSELSPDLFNDVLKLIEIENLDINKMKLYCYYDKEKNRYCIKITIGDISITVDRNTKQLVTFDKIKFNTLTQTICKDYKERFSMLQTEEINPIVTINKIEKKEKGKKEEVEVINLNFNKECTRTISFDGWDEETKKFEKIKIQNLSLEELEKCVKYDNLKNLLSPLNIDMIESKDKKKTSISLDEKNVITINIGTDSSISFDTKQNKITNIQGKFEKDFLKGLFKNCSENDLLDQLGISGFKFTYRDGTPRNAELIFNKDRVFICPDCDDNNAKRLNVIFDREKQEIVGFTEGFNRNCQNEEGISVNLSQLQSMLSDDIWEKFFTTNFNCSQDAKDLIKDIQYSRSEDDKSGKITWYGMNRCGTVTDITLDNDGKLIDLEGTCIFGDLKKTGMLYNITGHAEDMNWEQKLDKNNFDKYDKYQDGKYIQEKIRETEKLIEKEKAEINSMSEEKKKDIEKMEKEIEAYREKINEMENKRKEDFDKKKQIDKDGECKSSFAELKILKFKQYFIDPSKGGDYLDDFEIRLGDEPHISRDRKFMYVDGTYSITKRNEDRTIACHISFMGGENGDFISTDLEGSLESEFLTKLPKTSRDAIKNILSREFNIKTGVFNFNDSKDYEKNPVTDLYVEKDTKSYSNKKTLTIYFGGSKDSFIKISEDPFKIKEVKNVSLKKLKEMFNTNINVAENAIKMIEDKMKNKGGNVSDNYNIVYYSTNKDEIKFEPIKSKSEIEIHRKSEYDTVLAIKDKNNKFIEFLNKIWKMLSQMFSKNNNNETLHTLIDDLMNQLALLSDDKIWSNDKTLQEKAILHLNQLNKQESQQFIDDLSKHLKNAVLAKRNFDIISSLLSDQLGLSNKNENKNEEKLKEKDTEEAKKENIKIYTEILKRYEEKYYNATNNVNMLLFPTKNDIILKDINFGDDIEEAIDNICSDSNDDKDLSKILSDMIQAERKKIDIKEQIKEIENQVKKEVESERHKELQQFTKDTKDDKGNIIEECKLTKLKKEYRNKLLQQEINNEIEKKLNEFRETKREEMLKHNEAFKQLRDKKNLKNKQFNSNTINEEIDKQLKDKVEKHREEIESEITEKVSTNEEINKKLNKVVQDWALKETRKKYREIYANMDIKIEKRKQELLRKLYKDNDNKKDEAGKDNKDEELSYTIKSENENITETTIDNYEQNIITQTLIQVVSNKQNSIIKDILDNKAKSINFTEKLKNILKTNKSIKIEKENNQTGGVQQI